MSDPNKIPTHVIIYSPSRGEVETRIADPHLAGGLGEVTQSAKPIAALNPDKINGYATLLSSLVIGLGEGDHTATEVKVVTESTHDRPVNRIRALNEQISSSELFHSEGLAIDKEHITHIGPIAVASALPQKSDSSIKKQHAANDSERKRNIKQAELDLIVVAVRAEDKAKGKINLNEFDHAIITVDDIRLQLPLRGRPENILAARLLQVLSSDSHAHGISENDAVSLALDAMQIDERLLFEDLSGSKQLPFKLRKDPELSNQAVFSSLVNYEVSPEVGKLVISCVRQGFGRKEKVFTTTAEPTRFSLHKASLASQTQDELRPIEINKNRVRTRLASTQQSFVKPFSAETADFFATILGVGSPAITHKGAITIMNVLMQSGSLKEIEELAKAKGISGSPQEVKDQLLKIAHSTLGNDRFYAASNDRTIAKNTIKRGVR